MRRALGYVASHWSAHGSMNGLKASTVVKLVAPPMVTTTVTNAPRSPEAVPAAAPAVPAAQHAPGVSCEALRRAAQLLELLDSLAGNRRADD